jgi:S1-C subfamily serine protease
VIGIGTNLPEMGQMQPGREWIALSLHMRPGHSGGPLVDSRGRLVGINTMITGPDVGFAIPVQTVKTFLKETIGKAASTVVAV